jgi:hypothetical protein
MRTTYNPTWSICNGSHGSEVDIGEHLHGIASSHSLIGFGPDLNQLTSIDDYGTLILLKLRALRRSTNLNPTIQLHLILGY